MVRRPDGRRRVLTIAVADYPDEDEGFAKAIQHQLDLLDAWWCDPRLSGGRFVPEHATPLRSRRDVEEFLHHSGLREARPEEALLLFVAGHGTTAASGRHFLCLPDSDPQRMIATAFPTAEIAAAALDSLAGHVLIIINACDAGGVDASLAQMRRELSPWRRDTGRLAVLAAADFDQSVPIGAFGVLLERLYERLRTVSEITSECLSLEMFLTEMNAVVHAHGGVGLQPVFKVLEANAHLPHQALPNPGYRPPDDLVEPRRRQLAVAKADMDYWISRASGAGDVSDGCWYFSGRRDLNRQLAGFLTEGPPPGNAATLIVTGTAGSGKSAVIARAVTFADPAFRADARYQSAIRLAPADTVPPGGSVHAAILARNRTPDQILTLVLEAFGQPVPTPAAEGDHVQVLLRAAADAMTSAESSATVVIDGLDEADSPSLLITQVIAPLVRLDPPPRLVLGVRSSRPAPLAVAAGNVAVEQDRLLQLLYRATTIDGIPPLIQRTDGERTGADITEYLQALLEGTSAAGPDTAVALLAQLPDKASFLDARIAGFQLRNASDPIRLFHDLRWRSGLHLGTVGLLRQDLADAASPGLSPDVALVLLRAAAFALGAGIPRADIWPAIAEAVAGKPIPEAESAIASLLSGRLSGYLLTDTEAERTVYRPLHEHLAHVLREQPHLLHRPPEQP